MACMITVKGDGRGKYGKPKNDRTGPIEEFMVDNVYFYPLVLKHLQSCDKHDPNEVLRWYITRRTARGQNMVTGTLVKLALKYAKSFKIDPNLLNEYKWRIGINDYKYRKDLSLLDLAKAVKVQGLSGYFASLNDERAPDHDQLIAIHNVVQQWNLNDLIEMQDDGEFAQLFKVAEVMIT